MTGPDRPIDLCPFRFGPCPDHVHAYRPGICPDPPAAVTADWAPDPEEETDDG